MNIVIAGGRDFTAKEIAYKALEFLGIGSEDTIISGHATGADSIGEQYAKDHGIKCELYPAEWKKYGKAAGPIRNEEMAKIADRVIVFWDGKSRGTKNMLSLAEQYGCETVCFDYDGQLVSQNLKKKAPDQLTELVAAGDWQINPERIDGFLKDENFVGRQKLGSVYYGNDSYEFFGSIDASLRIVYFINSEPPVSFQLQHYTEAPNLDILRKLPPSGANGLSRQNYCEQFTSQIQIINDATVLSDTEELKKWLINKVLDDRNSWLSLDNLDAYKDIKEHGTCYFRQLDKEIAEYPDKLSDKRKLSVEEFDMLRNYYLSKIDRRNITKESSDFILKQMVKDGFDNERINIICKYANNGQGIGLPPEGYSNASLDKIREDVFKKPVIEKIK